MEVSGTLGSVGAGADISGETSPSVVDINCSTLIPQQNNTNIEQAKQRKALARR